MPERKIAERYLLHDELGSGGMGTVYRGLDLVTNQIVAVKQLKTHIAQLQIIERFKREGEALRALNHPNIVKILDAVEEYGDHYLVMEYVSGGDLASVLTEGQMALETVLKLAIDLADALTRAHKLNIIHRDLKPANVLIGEDGTLRLTDFGVAHIGSKLRMTETDTIVGTLAYLPPEAFSGGIIDVRADIWAFGVILFEMLSGQYPFAGESVIELVLAITTLRVPDLESICPTAPVGLIDLIYRMLEKDVQARIPSVRVIGAELEAILEGRAVTPQPARFISDVSSFIHRPKHNLPTQTTPFVGRMHELTELGTLLQDPTLRLVTVIAPGGMGKTRLSLEAAQRVFFQFEDGVYFVELAPLSDPHNIVSAIVDATGYQFQSDERKPKQQILDFLMHKNMLLVMDNFEHLLEAAPLVTEILQAAPHVNILVTSRQRLSQPGEALFHLSGMDFPEWETPKDALDYAAVKLFLNGAKRVQASFELTDDKLGDVARICHLVQGMPLGIVLAASWLGMLSLKEIVQELEESIDFLATDEIELPERQRSIRAVMAYSWHIMTEQEQQVMMKLSVFRRGFTRESAQDVAGANLRVLMSLVNKTLILRDVESGRYGIHELLRQYVAEQLALSPGEDEAIHSHMDYFIKMMQTFTADLKGSPRQLQTLERIELEIENLRVAWSYALKTANLIALDKVIDGFYLFYTMRSDQQTRDTLFSSTYQKLVAQGYNEQNPIMARILIRHRSYMRRHPNSDDLIKSLIQAATEDNNLDELAFCYYVWGGIQLRSNVKQALIYFEKCITYYEQGEPSYFFGVALNTVGYGYMLAGDVSRFVQYNKRSLSIAQQCFDRLGEAFAYWQLGLAELLMGNYAKAEHYQQNALQIRLEMRHGAGILWCQALLAHLKTIASDFVGGSQLAEEALALATDLNVDEGKAEANIALALAVACLGQYERARDLCEATRSMTRDLFKLNFTLPIVMQSVQVASSEYENAIQTTLHVLRSSSPEMIMARLSSLPIFAAFLAQKGGNILAAEVLGLWHNHPAVPSAEFRVFKQLQSDVKAAIGDNAYHAAWERGKLLDLETVLQELMAEFSDKPQA